MTLVEIPCSSCGALLMRKKRRKDAQCKACRKAEVHQWYLDHREELCAKERERWRSGTKKAQWDAWVAAHPARHRRNCRRANRRYSAKMRLLAKETEEALSCDCGLDHSQENRLRILRRMEGFDVAEIRDAYPCMWGPPDEHTTYRARRFFIDRKLLSERRPA